MLALPFCWSVIPICLFLLAYTKIKLNCSLPSHSIYHALNTIRVQTQVKNVRLFPIGCGTGFSMFMYNFLMVNLYFRNFFFTIHRILSTNSLICLKSLSVTDRACDCWMLQVLITLLYVSCFIMLFVQHYLSLFEGLLSFLFCCQTIFASSIFHCV